MPLVVLAPAIWFGRIFISERLQQLGASRSHLLSLAGIFAIAVCASTSVSFHWAASLATASTWCLLGLSAVLVSDLLHRDPRASRLLLGAMVLSVSIATALHWYNWKAGISSHHAFYTHPRLMGIHTLSGGLAAIAMLLQAPCRTSRVLWSALGILAWGGLLWSGSRSPLIGVSAGVLVWLLASSHRDRARLLGAVAILAAGGMILSLCFWTDAIGLGWWHVAERTAAAQTVVEVTSNRSSFWTEAMQHVMRSPWIGYGPDAYAFLTPRLEGAQPHNLLLQLWLDIGALGTAAALVLLATCLWHGWKVRHAEPAHAAWLALGAGSVIAALLDGYFYYPIAAIPAWLSLGACTALPATSQTAAAGAFTFSRAWQPGAILACGVLLLNGLLFHQAVHGTPPHRPDTPTAQLWRTFPSVTYNIDTWVDAWSDRFPNEALAASLLARRHSMSPEIFRVKTATLLARRGATQEALAELEAALHEVREEYRPTVERLMERIQATRLTSSVRTKSTPP